MKKIIYIALYWFIVQMIIAQLGTRISYKFLEKDNKYFRSWNIEQEGQLWQQLVKNMNDIQRFILETRRAEVVHLLSIFPVIAFFKASKSVKIINFIYVIIANVPCMIVQRYNRPKLIRIYNKLQKRKGD